MGLNLFLIWENLRLVFLKSCSNKKECILVIAAARVPVAGRGRGGQGHLLEHVHRRGGGCGTRAPGGGTRALLPQWPLLHGSKVIVLILIG